MAFWLISRCTHRPIHRFRPQSREETMRRIVIRPTQLLDMQYLGPQVRLLLNASVGVVLPGDQVITQRYGDWRVQAADTSIGPGNTVISVIADLIEDAGLIDPVHAYGPDMDAWPLR